MESVQEIWFWFSAAARYCAAASLVLMIWKIQRLPALFRIVSAIQICELITDSLASWLYDHKINNMPLLHLYTLVSFWLLSLFYREQFREKPFVQHHFWLYMAVISLLLVSNTLWLEPMDGFNSNAKTLVQCLFIAYGVYYLFDAFGRTDLLHPNDLSVALINMAILIYYAGSLFIFMFAKILNNGMLSPRSQDGLWMVNSLLYLIFQLLLLLAIWIQVFKGTKSSS